MTIALATGSAQAARDYTVFRPSAENVLNDIIIPDAPNPGGDLATIDIAVVFSHRFRLQLEGRGEYIADYILRSFDEVNRVFANTGLLTRMEVVGLEEWSLPAGADLITDQDRLIDHMERQTRDRNELAADLVQLWEVAEAGIDDPDICGWGQTIGPQRRISTTGFGYTTVVQGLPGTAYAGCYSNSSPESFALLVGHEIGHNLGSTHAWGEDDGEGVFEFAHGQLCGLWVGGYPQGTIMNTSGYRMPFFSTPTRFQDGEPCGVPAGQPNPADNRETIMRTAGPIAQLRSRAAGVGTVSAVVPTTIGERNGSLPVALVRTNVLSSASLEVLIFGESARAGEDFQAPARQSVTFAPGEAVKTLQIPLTADGVREGAESLLLFLQRPENLSILGERAFRVEIQDNLIDGITDLLADTVALLTGGDEPPGDEGGAPQPTDSTVAGGGGGGGGGPDLLILLLVVAGAGRRRA